MIDKEDFEKWALLSSLDFKYNYQGVFTWFNHDFWLLDEACKVQIFKQYNNGKN